MTSTREQKAHENKLRALAGQHGFRLSKSRTRDPGAVDYGRWMLYGRDGNRVIISHVVRGIEAGATLAEVEQYLRAEHAAALQELNAL